MGNAHETAVDFESSSSLLIRDSLFTGKSRYTNHVRLTKPHYRWHRPMPPINFDHFEHGGICAYASKILEFSTIQLAMPSIPRKPNAFFSLFLAVDYIVSLLERRHHSFLSRVSQHPKFQCNCPWQIRMWPNLRDKSITVDRPSNKTTYIFALDARPAHGRSFTIVNCRARKSTTLF